MSSLLRYATIQIRRDTAGNWTSENPTPYQGEWCLETDSEYTKLGDGSTAWNNLRYNVGPSWDDIRVPALAGKIGVGSPPAFTKVFDNGAGSEGVFTYLFDSTAEEQLFFIVQMPHDWKLESDIEAHVHWFPTANGSAGQKVSWGLEYTIAEHDGVFGNTAIIYGDTATLDETLVDNKHYVTELGIISMSGITTISTMLICRVFRDATGTGGTDNYTSDVGLIETDFHYIRDDLGSRLEYTK